MKTLLSLLSLSIPSFVHAAPPSLLPWAELEEAATVSLKSDLRVSRTFTLKAGTQFVIHEIDPLAPVQVVAFSLKLVPCTPALDVGAISMTLLSNRTYGFEYASGCNASFYVELRDLYKESFFTESR